MVWLGSSLLVAGYVLLVVVLDGTPNWLDVLVFTGWVALASRWLGPIADWLQRRQLTRWVAIAVPPMALLVIALPWALHLPVSGGLWGVNGAGRYFLSLADLTPRNLLLTIPQTLYIVNYLAWDLGHAYLQGTAAIMEHFQAAGLSLARWTQATDPPAQLCAAGVPPRPRPAPPVGPRAPAARLPPRPPVADGVT
ncbi:MAG: hypothetical protein U9Q70_10130 [Chloroflexota bacterium]|nr:hypothetical protein [Chloroflexota bacterium]